MSTPDIVISMCPCRAGYRAIIPYHSSLTERPIGTVLGRDQPDSFLPARVKEWIEQTYYVPVNVQASFESLIHDPAFLKDPARHPAFYSDHGVVHVRDIARQVLRVLKTINGVLIPWRPHDRLDQFMKGYGVLLAYVHDVGMSDFSAFGRTMHPEFAAQIVFDPIFDQVMDVLWEENSGNIAARLLSLARCGALTQDPKLVLRELLALSCCHSKSKVPAPLLKDPTVLRWQMLEIVGTDLRTLYRRALLVHETVPESETESSRLRDKERRDALSRFYIDLRRDAFAWLLCSDRDVKDLVDDVVDVVRALRCADALRQRGTVLETSGQYQLFVDAVTGGALSLVRTRGGDVLVSIPDIVGGGEANLAACKLDAQGNIHFAFHRGAFADEPAIQRAVEGAALVIDDVQMDIRGSFDRTGASSPDRTPKSAGEILILLEDVADNPSFARLVGNRLVEMNPDLKDAVVVEPRTRTAALETRTATAREQRLYLTGAPVPEDPGIRREWLRNIARRGHKTDQIDPFQAFEGMKVVTVREGTTLIVAGDPSLFVYVPLDDGLNVIPLGGYAPRSVMAWVPVGNTGVIRGAERNATVVATVGMALLMIPKETYLRHWHYTHTLDDFIRQQTDALAP